MVQIKRSEIANCNFSGVRVEPTDTSFKQAIAFAQADNFDAFVAVGYVS
jgi:alcohol dehydrogenase YqhD (iron-dependent ADH family)